MQPRAAPNMSRAKRLTSLGTAVEGGRQPPGNHNMQVLRKENEGKGRGQPEISPSNIQATEGRGNAMATSDMGRAKRLIALGTTVEGGRQPSGKHEMQALQKGNEEKGRGQPEIPLSYIRVTVGRDSAAMQGHSQSSTEMASLTTLGSLSNDEENRLQLVNASEVHATGLSATPVIHQTPIKGSAGHETSVSTTPTSFPPQNADFEPIAMELEDTSVSMSDDQAQVLEGAIEIYKAKVKRIRGANFAKELKKRVENETVWEKAKAVPRKKTCGKAMV